MRRVLVARVTYSRENFEGVEIEDLGPYQPGVNRAAPASLLPCLRN